MPPRADGRSAPVRTRDGFAGAPRRVNPSLGESVWAVRGPRRVLAFGQRCAGGARVRRTRAGRLPRGPERRVLGQTVIRGHRRARFTGEGCLPSLRGLGAGNGPALRRPGQARARFDVSAPDGGGKSFLLTLTLFSYPANIGARHSRRQPFSCLSPFRHFPRVAQRGTETLAKRALCPIAGWCEGGPGHQTGQAMPPTDPGEQPALLVGRPAGLAVAGRSYLGSAGPLSRVCFGACLSRLSAPHRARAPGPRRTYRNPSAGRTKNQKPVPPRGRRRPG